MALTSGTRYWGKRIGANLATGKPVLAVNDPCVAPAVGVRKIVRRVGTNLTTGKPVYAIKDCTTETPQVGSRYPVRRVGTNLATGKPVYSLRCQTCSCPTKIKITGCGAAPGNVSGATVTIGASSGVTDAAGEVTLSIPGAGTYTVQVVAAGFANFSGVRALACNGTTNINLTAGSGYRCSSCYCARPLPETLYWTTSTGTWPLTYRAAQGKWAGCEIRPESCVTGVDPEGNCIFGGNALFVWVFDGCQMRRYLPKSDVIGCENDPDCTGTPACYDCATAVTEALLHFPGWTWLDWDFGEDSTITPTCDPFSLTWHLEGLFMQPLIDCFGDTQVLSE